METAVAQPSAANSTVVINGQVSPCQFRFRSDGGYDIMSVDIIVRDAANIPIAGAPVQVTLVPIAGGTLAFCTCCPNPKAGTTNAAGAVSVLFSQIGGRGRLRVRVDAFDAGVVVNIANPAIDFTSPDMDGSCQPTPASATNVIDLGLWAACLPPAPYCQFSDFNCDGVVNIIDLGLWAGGLGKGCLMAPCL